MQKGAQNGPDDRFGILAIIYRPEMTPKQNDPQQRENTAIYIIFELGTKTQHTDV